MPSKLKQGSKEDWLSKVSSKLKRLRLLRGYRSYESFALDHGFDRKQYWRIEQGTNLTLKTLIKVLDAHDMNLKDFFSDFQ